MYLYIISSYTHSLNPPIQEEDTYLHEEEDAFLGYCSYTHSLNPPIHPFLHPSTVNLLLVNLYIYIYIYIYIETFLTTSWAHFKGRTLLLVNLLLVDLYIYIYTHTHTETFLTTSWAHFKGPIFFRRCGRWTCRTTGYKETY